MPREDRLGLRDAGPLQQLRGAEHRRRRLGRSVARQQVEIGAKQVAQRGRAVGDAGALGDHLVEQRAAAGRVARSHQEAGLARLGRKQRRAVREAVGQRGDRRIERRSRARPVAARLGDQRPLDLDFAQQPAGRLHLALAHREDLAARLDQPGLGLVQLPLLAKRDAAELGRLRVEDRRALGRGQVGADVGHLLAGGAFAVDRQAQRRGDQPVADLLGILDFGDRRDRDRQRRHRFGRLMLVELVDRAIVADQPLHHAVAARAGGLGARQQPLGRAKLPRFDCCSPWLASASASDEGSLTVAARQAFEEFGAFGEAAGIVADIGFDPRARRIERAGLDPGEGRRVADLGRRDLHRALLRPVGDDRRQRQPQRRIVAGQPFGQIMGLAALDGIAAIIEPGRLVAAGERPDRADTVDRRRFPRPGRSAARSAARSARVPRSTARRTASTLPIGAAASRQVSW